MSDQAPVPAALDSHAYYRERALELSVNASIAYVHASGGRAPESDVILNRAERFARFMIEGVKGS